MLLEYREKSIVKIPTANAKLSPTPWEKLNYNAQDIFIHPLNVREQFSHIRIVLVYRRDTIVALDPTIPQGDHNKSRAKWKIIARTQLKGDISTTETDILNSHELDRDSHIFVPSKLARSSIIWTRYKRFCNLLVGKLRYLWDV